MENFAAELARELREKNYLTIRAQVVLETNINAIILQGVKEELVREIIGNVVEGVIPESLNVTHEEPAECAAWFDGCCCNTQTLVYNIERAGIAADVAEAAHKELKFTYSHPMAAERGDVWTERSKTSELYKALKIYQEFRR